MKIITFGIGASLFTAATFWAVLRLSPQAQANPDTPDLPSVPARTEAASTPQAPAKLLSGVMAPPFVQKNVSPSTLSDKSSPTTQPDPLPTLPYSAYRPSLSSQLDAIKLPPQAFSISPNQVQFLTLKNGTRLEIPANAFVVEETGEVVRGEVLLLARDYLTQDDMMKAKLNTITREGVLESGGMLYLEAQYEGKRCVLRKGSQIEVNIPILNEETVRNNMQVYTGKREENGDLYWEVVPGSKAEVVEVKQLVQRKQTEMEDLDFKSFLLKSFQVQTLEGAIEFDEVRYKIAEIKSRFDFQPPASERMPKRLKGYISAAELQGIGMKNYCKCYEHILKKHELSSEEHQEWLKNANASPYAKFQFQTSLLDGKAYFINVVEGNNYGFDIRTSYGASNYLKNLHWAYGDNVHVSVMPYFPIKYKKQLTKGLNLANNKNCEEYWEKRYADYLQNQAMMRLQFVRSQQAWGDYNTRLTEQMQKTKETFEVANKLARAYQFKLDQMGWINCDCIPPGQLYANAQITLESEADFVSAYLVYTHRNGMICTSAQNKSVFYLGQTIKKEPVMLIVIKEVDKRIYYAKVKQLTAAAYDLPDSAFKLYGKPDVSDLLVAN